MAKPSFREQMLKVREDALLASVNRLLAEKGFEAMTIDDVAAEVGIARASLYKHFASKEALAAEAMTRVLDRALAACEALAANTALDDFGRLHAVARWALEEHLGGRMPSLPSHDSALRTALAAHRGYLDRLVELSERLGAWIEAAQAAGRIDPGLPPIVVLYTLFALGCDPVASQLKAGGEYGVEQIVDWVLRSRFAGLAGPADAPAQTSTHKRAS